MFSSISSRVTVLNQASQTVSLSLMSKRSAKGIYLFGTLHALLRTDMNNYRFVVCFNALNKRPRSVDRNCDRNCDTRIAFISR
jgi:hypothetical protein